MFKTDSLPLFNSSHQFDGVSNSLEKNIKLIETMAELDYIELTPAGLIFTNPGIEYMMRNHEKFMSNINSDKIDLSGIKTISMPHHNLCDNFIKNNLLSGIEIDEPDYNKNPPKHKNEDQEVLI